MLREKESLEESKETVSFSELLAMVPGLEMGQAQRLAKNSSRFALGVSSLSLDERVAGGQASSLAASPPNAEGQKSTETPQKDRAGKKATFLKNSELLIERLVYNLKLLF